MSKKYYITTPIYYINDVPHIGHAYTTIAADVLARYHRKKGDEVFFLTGTDEHGAKIAEAAEKAGKKPEDFVRELRPKFEVAWKNLNIGYDEFFYTTNPEHEKLVSEFIEKIKDNGYVEKRKYEGLYCVGCERFLKESELVDGLCPDHKKAPVKQSEENYFFKLSAFEDKLLKAVESGELRVAPIFRKNEIIGKIRQGLEDVSISRENVKWGIPFPGDESQTIYVWFDALLNYYTATKIYHKDGFWPSNLHLMAKDILWFHAVIWPAMLMATNLPLPKKVFAHGFFTINGAKMSKTIGNVIDPNVAVEKFGADAVRYALLREFPFGEDGDISMEKIESHYNALANNIGNLLQRTISMINRYNCAGAVRAVGISRLANAARDDSISVDKDLDDLQFMEALKKIDELAIAANKDIAVKEPWVLAKEGRTEELAKVLGDAFSNLSAIAEFIEPFMPETAEKMKNQLESLKPEPLFPKIQDK